MKLIQVKDLRPNPFRNIDRYPIDPEKVEALRESIKSTGYWGNILARQNNGHVEIAYGHHRLKAIKDELGASEKVEVILRDLSDDDMLRIMARENMEEWRTLASVEIETVRAVVAAFAQGKIELDAPHHGENKSRIRPAHSFIPGPVDDGARAYTATTIGRYLGPGWMEKSGERATGKVTVALTALQYIEEGICKDKDFNGLTTKQAEAIVDEARKKREVYERAARLAPDENEKKELREKGKKQAGAVTRAVGGAIKSGKAGYKSAGTIAASVGSSPKNLPPPNLTQFVRQLVPVLNRILSDKDDRVEKLEAIIEFREHLEIGPRDDLVRALAGIAKRAGKHIIDLGAPKSKQLQITGGGK